VTLVDVYSQVFRALFYALSSSNYTSSTSSPYDPSAPTDSSSPPASVISALESFDVFAELSYSPRQDAVNGFAPPNSTWHNGNNALGVDDATPYFIAKDFGPKYLNSQSEYQVIQPLVTPVQSAGNFTLSTISISKQLRNTTTQFHSYPGHAAFEVLEGQLSIMLEGEALDLLQGDVVFIPGNSSYGYFSKVAFTKVLYISQGADSLDTALISKSMSWGSPVWPTS
jgi:quercetin dioxygenase-like cupin family protein